MAEHSWTEFCSFNFVFWFFLTLVGVCTFYLGLRGNNPSDTIPFFEVACLELVTIKYIFLFGCKFYKVFDKEMETGVLSL